VNDKPEQRNAAVENTYGPRNQEQQLAHKAIVNEARIARTNANSKTLPVMKQITLIFTDG
jgi:hypothetical protein